MASFPSLTGAEALWSEERTVEIALIFESAFTATVPRI